MTEADFNTLRSDCLYCRKLYPPARPVMLASSVQIQAALFAVCSFLLRAPEQRSRLSILGNASLIVLCMSCRFGADTVGGGAADVQGAHYNTGRRPGQRRFLGV